jgi:serine phosphatase RsbU (regulator of sigma subunit)
METQSRHFAYRILAFNGLLLIAVLGLVALASAAIYDSTCQDALIQAQARQELLAQQTARGIETFYTSLSSDLAWITRGPQAPPATGAVTPGRRAEAARDPREERLVTEQLGGRVRELFVYNKQTEAIVSLLTQQTRLTTAQLPEEMHQWLHGVDRVKVSSLVQLNGRAVSLVAASFGRDDPLLIVAVVPGDQLDFNFLRLLTDKNSAGATLADSQLRVITSTNRKLTGLNLGQFDNGDLRDMLHAFEDRPVLTSHLFSEPLDIHGITLGPRMVTLAPVSVAQEHWVLFFAEPVGNIEVNVDKLFKRAVYWAAFVAVSITAVLVSAAVQMIRWRFRLDRIRHEALEREVRQARLIQQQWLPDLSTAPPEMDVAAVNLPANHISGDFYNWFRLPDGRLAVVIGDVTGHGMVAAFLMATTQLIVRNTLARLPDPGTAMEEVNRQLTSQMFRGQFVTMLILTLDFERKRIDVASAGHPAPLIVGDGSVRSLEVQAELVLGVEKDVRYPTQRFTLPDSSGLLLYTDGVVDAEGAADESFGLRRLQESLGGHSGSATEMVEAVIASVQQFQGGRDLEDDLTMLAVQWRQTAAALPVQLVAES